MTVSSEKNIDLSELTLRVPLNEGAIEEEEMLEALQALFWQADHSISRGDLQGICLQAVRDTQPGG